MSVKKLDFNFRISQKLGITYTQFSANDSDALKLLESLKDTNDFSLEWDAASKEFSLIIFINLFGQKFTGYTIRQTIVTAFSEIYLSGEEN